FRWLYGLRERRLMSKGSCAAAKSVADTALRMARAERNFTYPHKSQRKIVLAGIFRWLYGLRERRLMSKGSCAAAKSVAGTALRMARAERNFTYPHKSQRKSCLQELYIL
ncbi:MAG: hypothetical protein K2G28_10975, partial [Acetatifactor sp.]|nr:hypothetical protein [Acetatifactor sp.]